MRAISLSPSMAGFGRVASLAAVGMVVALAGCVDDGPTAPQARPGPALARVGPHGVGAPASIAFHSDRAGNLEIYVMNPDGSGVERVTNRPGTENFYPDISTDGRWIVFTSVVGAGETDIYLVSSAGGDAINLTNTPSVSEDWARWSPNGKQIAFHRGTGNATELYILDIASGVETRLTDNTIDDMWPEWSPDGKRLAFRRSRDVHVMEVSEAASVVRLTTDPALDQMAAWSQDGKWLAFMSFRDGYCSVFLMNADGSDQINLTPGAAGWCSRAPSWTRDGRILFMSLRPGTSGPAIFAIEPDGSGLVLLTDAAGEDGGPTAR